MQDMEVQDPHVRDKASRALKLRAAGASISEVGEALGVDVQEVRALLMLGSVDFSSGGDVVLGERLEMLWKVAWSELNVARREGRLADADRAMMRLTSLLGLMERRSTERRSGAPLRDNFLRMASPDYVP